MELFAMGIISAFNLIIIKWKFEHNRKPDAVLDLTAFLIVCFLFSGSTAALFVGMVASAFISVYLLISPPKLGSANA